MNQQKQLLDELRIARDEALPKRPPRTVYAGGAFLVAALMGGMYLLGRGPAPAPAPAAAGAPASSSVVTAARAEAPGASAAVPAVPASDSVLSASGYITARRTATV